ncbi:MAG TPA: hypothetical protein VH475_24925 [Tepidisphaeraceae bacterium]|jgi:leucyl/phenylalanyl-tRNA--protein transferase
MRRFLDMIRSGRVGDDPVAALYHYVRGQMVNWINGHDGPTHWTCGSHRGVQFLDKVAFPRKQKRYIFAPQFEIRYDTAFEEVLRGCADRARDAEHKTWIADELIRALVGLHRMGFAHSYEAWSGGQLVGGGFGVQLGSMISCDSMFHRASNASKAAYGQALLHLQKRGFKVVDTNGVANHMVNYGEEWIPQWRFERLILECLKESPSVTDGRPCPRLPWQIRTLLPLLWPTRLAVRRMPWYRPPELPPEMPPQVIGGGPAASQSSPPTGPEAQPVTPPASIADKPDGERPDRPGRPAAPIS